MAAPIQDVDEAILIACSYFLISKAKWPWVHEINRKRKTHREYSVLMRELNSDEDKFYGYFRMTKAQFAELHRLIKDDVRKLTTSYRLPISSRERLAICLRYKHTNLPWLNSWLSIVTSSFFLCKKGKTITQKSPTKLNATSTFEHEEWSSSDGDFKN